MTGVDTKLESTEDFVRVAAERAARDWDDLETFLGTFNEILHEVAINNRFDASVPILLALAQEHGKDVIRRMGEVATRAQTEPKIGKKFWGLTHLFYETLPDLSFDPSILADTLDAALIAEGSDMAGGGAYKAIEELSRRSPETADLLFVTFVARPNSPVASLASSALLGLAQVDFREAHRRALSLSQADARVLKRTGIGTLGSFRYSEVDGDLLRATFPLVPRIK